MKIIPSLLIATLILSNSPANAAQVAVLTGNYRPDSSVIEAPNTLSYDDLFTTVVFSGTSWTAVDGVLRMTTAAIRGIWFGSHPTAGGDPGAFLPGSASAGNRLEMRSLITSGSKSWSAYFRDTDGYRGRIDFEATELANNRPGVTVEFASGWATVGGPGFDFTEMNDYAIHMHEGIVAYFINGLEVARGPALQPMEAASVLVGDPTGNTATGAGSMWVDSFSFDNAAGAIPVIPEPGSAGLLGLACAGLLFRRRRARGESAAQVAGAPGKTRPASRRRTAHGIAASLLLTLPAGATVRWELSGTLNYVNPLLSGTFAVGQQFTIGMDLDDSVPMTNGQRIDFYTSSGMFENAVSNGSVVFSNYNVGFASTASHGAVQVRNNETDAAFGYDQLNLNFFSFEPGAVTAPQADGFDLRSVEFNFTDESSPSDMITGSGGSFPTIDVPFIGPDTFNLARSTNAPYHFILRFSGGAVEGTNFIRGTINTSNFSTGGGGFADWPALADLPQAQRGPDATPAGDGVPNLVKYAIGIGPLESAAGRIPQEVLESTVNDETYPTFCFTRDSAAAGVTLRVEVAADVDFTADLGTTVVSTEDLGNGLERVCVRSNARFSDQTRQFFRLAASEE